MRSNNVTGEKEAEEMCEALYELVPPIPVNASRFCGGDGTWQKSNYSQCHLAAIVLGEKEEIFASASHLYGIFVIYWLGYGLTLIVLATSLFIFMYFRCWLTRSTINSDLIFLIPVLIVLILIVAVQVKGVTANYILDYIAAILVSTQSFCRALVAFTNFCHVANFFWMLVEGVHIFARTVIPFSSGHAKMTWYSLLGWVVPALIIVTWMVVKGVVDKSPCWLTRNAINSDLIFLIPVLIVLIGLFVGLYYCLLNKEVQTCICDWYRRRQVERSVPNSFRLKPCSRGGRAYARNAELSFAHDSTAVTHVSYLHGSPASSPLMSAGRGATAGRPVLPVGGAYYDVLLKTLPPLQQVRARAQAQPSTYVPCSVILEETEGLDSDSVIQPERHLATCL
ncbi:PREDICTED: vasoactive intestinal polypeptide receptor 1-like [Priapulus caudatus]|uniref:Vasoactive intestinal polypeptide receptor 1-like n=1 Tax=Priapulus caudatus TaxID=37621 RepID=A0ABM1ENY0_PRICU|nr:PREDICTED: vasoactive intestinal polypeptide receptor 1-like [Priapulus caudatus]